MQSKRNVLFVIMGLLSMIIAGYALFITVFDQIISQNEGFFYAIVFGGILILVYVFINVGSKLLVISDVTRKGRTIRIVSMIILVLLCGLFAYFRLSYTSSYNPESAIFYNSAILINNDSLFSSHDMTTKLLNNPSEFSLALVFSTLFNIFPESDNLVIIFNVIMCAAIAVMIYFIVLHFADSLCGVIAAAFSLFLPMQMYAVYTFTADVFLAFLFFAFLLSAVTLIYAQSKLRKIFSFAAFIITFSLLIFSEPVLVILGALIVAVAFVANRNNLMLVLAGFVFGIILFVGLIYYKAMIFDMQINDMFSAVLGSFNNRRDTSTGSIISIADIKEMFDTSIGAEGKHIENNYSFLSKLNGGELSSIMAAWLILENQLLYMLVLILSVSAIFTAIQKKDNRLIVGFAAATSSVFYLILTASREMNTYFLHSVFAIFAGCGFFYIYINHHPEAVMVIGPASETVMTEETNPEEDEKAAKERELQYQKFLIRANALIFYDEDDGLYKMIRSEDRQLALEMKNHEDIHENDSTDIVGEGDINIISSNSGSVYTTESCSVAGAYIADEVIADAVYVEIDNYQPTAYEGGINQQENQPEGYYSSQSYPSSDGDSDAGYYDENAEDDEEGNNGEVTLIPNPLPLPVKKPHVNLDYDRVKEDDDGDDADWDFDIQGDDFDDFDH